jgi:signal transduction histidine kinase
MSIKLKEDEELKSQYEENRKLFIANISHDLKTPITSILGHAQGLKDGVADNKEKKERYIDIIYNNAIYSNKLIEDLFLISQLDINQYDYHFDQTKVKNYFEDLCLEFKYELEEEQITFEYEINIENQITVEMDHKAIRQVLLNIITNSKKYSGAEDLVIKMIVIVEDKYVKVSVKDNGQGIKSSEIENIFDRFYRIDKARRNETGGTGLGLSICKEIVNAHGGVIKAESVVGEYATIIFTISKDGDQYE